MISGIGIDLVHVASVAESIQHYGDQYLERVFTRDEIAYCGAVPSSMQRYAGRIAAKEAAMKALATGLESGVDWLDFEVTNEPSGEPRLRAHGLAAEMLRKKGVYRMRVSLSHLPEYAIAQVIFERSRRQALLYWLRGLYRNRTAD